MDAQNKPIAKDGFKKTAGYKRFIGCIILLALGFVFCVFSVLVYNQTRTCNSLDILFKISGCEARTKIFGSSLFRLSKNGDLIVSLVIDRKKELDILDLKTNTLKHIRSVDGQPGSDRGGDLMDDLALTNDGKVAAVVSDGYLGFVEIDVDNPTPQWLDLPNKDFAMRVAISPDGKTLAAAINSDPDYYVALYSIPDGKKTGELHGDGDNLAVAYSPTGQPVTAFGGQIQFWDAIGKTVIRRSGSDLTVNALSFSPDGATLVATTGGGVISFTERDVNVFRTEDGAQLYQLRFDPNEFFDDDAEIAFSADSQLLTATSCNQVHVFQLSDGKALKEFSLYHVNDSLSSAPCLNAIQFASDGKSIYYAWAARKDNTINKMRFILSEE